MLTSFSTTRATSTCGVRGGGDCFWPQPAHKSEPKRLNRRALPIRNTVRDPFMPLFSSTWIFLGSAGINAQNAKCENVSALRKASSDASVRQTALLDGDYL